MTVRADVTQFFRVVTAGTILTVLGCSGPQPLPPYERDMVKITSAARAAYDRGAVAHAARLYLDALRKARAADDASSIADSAYNAALSLVAAKQYDRAQALLEEAAEELKGSGKPAADVWLVQGHIARLEGNQEAVQGVLAAITRSLEPDDAPSQHTQAYLLAAHVACDRSDAAAGRSALAQAERLLPDVEDALVHAAASHVRGRILLLEASPAQAAIAFDREAGLRKKAGQLRRMAAALGRAGEAYQQAGDTAAACDRLYRAARSLYAQADATGALAMIRTALPEAEISVKHATYRPLKRLFAEIKAAVEKENGEASSHKE